MTAIASSTQDKVRGFEVGAVDYITKPIQLEPFADRLMLIACGLWNLHLDMAI